MDFRILSSADQIVEIRIRFRIKVQNVHMRMITIILSIRGKALTSLKNKTSSHDILTSRHMCTQCSNRGKGVEEAIKLGHYIWEIQIINIGLIIKGSVLTRKNHVLFIKIHETSIKNRE